MAISYVSGASAATNTVSMPSHQAGDLIVAFAFRDGSVTNPALPAGWTDVALPTGANSCSVRVGYKIAASSSETTGTWSNATGVTVAVYRKASTDAWLNPVLVLRNGTGTTIDYTFNGSFGVEPNPAQANTQKWYARFAGARAATNLTASTPSGWTARSGTATETRLMDTDGDVGSTTLPHTVGGNTQTVTGSSGWITAIVTLEVWDGDGIVCMGRGAGQTASALNAPTPKHEPGDLFIVQAYRNTSATPASLPAGWTNVASGGANGISSRIGYKIATTSNEAIGTWTNADSLTLGIYRSATGTFDTIAAGGFVSGSSATADFSTNRVPVPGSVNRYVRFVGMAPSWPTDPAGWSMYLAFGTPGFNVLFDSNGVVTVPADSVGDVSMPLSSSGAWQTNTIQLASVVKRSWTLPAAARMKLFDGTFDIDSDSWKLALVSASSNIGAASTAFAGVTGELPTANGYTAGGAAVTLTRSGTTSVTVSFASNPVVWTASGGSITAAYAVLYETGGDVLAYAPLNFARVPLNSTSPGATATPGSEIERLEVYGPVYSLA